MSGLAVPVERVALRDAAWAPPLGLGLGVALVGAADGGYFPTSWGWVALGLAWAAALAVTVGGARAPSRLQLAFFGVLLALVGWTWLSAAWADDPGAAVQEGLRTLTLPLAALAVVLIVRRAAVETLLAGLWAGIVAVCGYGLLTRLVPDRLGAFDPIAGYRLSEPLGYWNALGAFAAIGILVALGLAAEARGRALRAGAAASVPLLASCLYFTFSRGAWVALAVGVMATFAVAPRRAALAGATVAAGLPTAAAIWIGSRSDALTSRRAGLVDAAADGHRLALVLGALAATAAAASLLARRRRFERAAALALGAVAVALLAAALVRLGPPHTWPARAWDAFDAPAPATGGDLNRRLLSLSGSGRVPQWEVALDQARERFPSGGGAGSYEGYWLEHRELPGTLRDAHSVYLETFGELGIAGVCLLGGGLLVPLYAAVRRRRRPLAAAACGAYVAYLVHAGIDWDWEMPAVTLTALSVGATSLADGESARLSRTGRRGLLALVAALGAAAFVGLVGHLALAESSRAARAGDWDRAIAQARRARTWAPWSAQPHERLGEAYLARGEPGRASAAFRRALEHAPNDWELWLDLARATEGPAQQRALAEASRLNPLSPEVAQLRRELAALGPIEVGG